MESLKYTVIKTDAQYYEYCNKLEQLLDEFPEEEVMDEVELLETLIFKYDDEHNTLRKDYDPIERLTYLMDDHKMKAKDLAIILGVSPGLVSDILNYKKGISKEMVRKLADRFKMRQEAFNQPYELKNAIKPAPKRGIGASRAKITKGR